jgi:pimeloyl-ACP methyl ester carboxylesterase
LSRSLTKVHDRTDVNRNSPCTLESQTQDLAAALSGIGEPAVVFGHSFGGVIAMSTALTEPARVARLVLLRAMFPAAPSAVLPGQAHFPDDMPLVDTVIG